MSLSIQVNGIFGQRSRDLPCLFIPYRSVKERSLGTDSLIYQVRIHSSSTDKPDKEDALLVKTEARPTLAEEPGAKALYQRD